MGIAMGLAFAFVLTLIDTIGVMALINHSADPKTTMLVFVGSFTLAFGVGATLTGFVFMMMEEHWFRRAVLASAIWMKRSGPNDQVVTAHAILLGDRINTSGIEGETLSTSPLAIRIDKGGFAVLFRYGVVVLIGLSPQQEQEFLEKLSARVSGRYERYDTRKKPRS
jgi:uncharacterized Rmd1/YagE family protein